ncbi:hypothetical protein Acr_24g0002710 [Actinidia rufa]|uniref:Uncharacterized protein n=1 Tax=Actinidia rufa TaxID=165716 RepID=A0A7J0GTM6_9ERIC|nr:hypothetical protein Acr_24g0002710 [Actinidia rufa]
MQIRWWLTSDFQWLDAVRASLQDGNSEKDRQKCSRADSLTIKLVTDEDARREERILGSDVERLVHDDAALARFRRHHEIPDDVLIKRPSPREIAVTTRENSDRITFHIRLIRQAGLRFVVSPKMKDVMAHCGLTFMCITDAASVLTRDAMNLPGDGWMKQSAKHILLHCEFSSVNFIDSGV